MFIIFWSSKLHAEEIIMATNTSVKKILMAFVYPFVNGTATVIVLLLLDIIF